MFLRTTVVPRGSSRKFLRPWKGPYKVVEVVGPTTYRIADCSNPSKKQVVHFNRLKPAPQNGGPSQNGNNQQGNQQPAGNAEGTDVDQPGDSSSEESEYDVIMLYRRAEFQPPPDPPLPAAPEPLPVAPGQPPLRCSTRTRRPPTRFGDPLILLDSTLDDVIL